MAAETSETATTSLEKVASAPEINAEAAHKRNREKLLEAMAEEDRKKKEDLRRRRERIEAGADSTNDAETVHQKKQEIQQRVEHLEITSSKFGFHGGDEFKQMAMADESHIEEAHRRQRAKAKEAMLAAEVASLEEEQSKLEEEQAHKTLKLQAVLEKRRREAEEHARAQKRARPGVKLAVKKVAHELPALVAAEPVGKAAGLGLLGSYDSDDDSEESGA
eukprot:TRINITY_DN37830_c0_g1_i1.p1 TRINITY_DN37830_c0_g1~~TRINITY_DN37830_c0_g1_i1.p1  ORF type:complete len:254 (+),score=76.81 TRINITY_DN37830_c0_g1_i1:104-763(+)